jgi:ubiquinone/menaquinone biosynthesis C-methylase UbiE
MEHDAKLARLVIGLRGLGLLRHWPFGDEAEAEAELRTIADMLAHRDDLPLGEVFHLDTLDIADGYVAWSETYDDVPNPLAEVEQRALELILSEIQPGDALDVACGTGRVTEMLCELGHRVVAVDPSEAMLDRARAKGLAATFRSGPFDALPVEDASFNLVTCGLALTHVTDLGPPFRELARVMRPGGMLITTDVHPIATALGAQALFRRADGSRAATTNHQHWVSDYVRAITAAGLHIEGCIEPMVDEGYKVGLRSEDVRMAADVSLTGLPLVLIWVLRRGEESFDDVVGERRSDEQAGGAR